MKLTKRMNEIEEELRELSYLSGGKETKRIKSLTEEYQSLMKEQEKSDKQIEEMAKPLNEATFGVNKHIIADHIHKPEAIEEIAIHLYNAGYRKTTDVAEEIFAEIEKHFLSGTTSLGLSLYSIGSGTYIKLKKKYTESENNNE